jgi:nucleoside-diphosphate-sugar epimerase
MRAAPTPDPEIPMPRFDRLLITGAAGNLGTVLRQGLAPLATTLRLTDRAGMGEAAPNEEIMPAELGDFDAIMEVVKGCDAVVHFGAAAFEKPWAEILESSIKGGYNVYEAARRHGIKRIVYASSIHAVGYVRREEGADTGRIRSTGCRNASSRTWRRCISTSSASSPRVCASTPASRSPPTAAILRPG